MPYMKALSLIMLTGEPNKETYYNGRHLKNINHIDLIFHVHILGA